MWLALETAYGITYREEVGAGNKGYDEQYRQNACILFLEPGWEHGISETIKSEIISNSNGRFELG